MKSDTSRTAEQQRREFNSRFGVHWALLSRFFTGQQFWHRSRQRIRPVAGETVLEVACGAGNILIPLAQQAPAAHFIGVDIAEQMVLLAQQRARRAGLSNILFTVGDMTALYLPEESVNRVICSRVLGHYADMSPVFAELARVLKPGGTAIIINEVKVKGFHWLKFRLMAGMGVLLNPGRRAFIFEYLEKTPTAEALQMCAWQAGLRVTETLWDGHTVCLVCRKGGER